MILACRMQQRQILNCSSNGSVGKSVNSVSGPVAGEEAGSRAAS